MNSHLQPRCYLRLIAAGTGEISFLQWYQSSARADPCSEAGDQHKTDSVGLERVLLWLVLFYFGGGGMSFYVERGRHEVREVGGSEKSWRKRI